MIVCNGITGLCLVVGAIRHHVLRFRTSGTSAAFATLATLATLSLVLPALTTSAPALEFTGAQLAFAGDVLTRALRGRRFHRRAPRSVVGIVIALLVFTPETGAAVRAAYHNRLQTSLNLALGSALARHRADDPRDSGCLDLADNSVDPRPGGQGDRVARPDAGRRNAHPEHRPGDAHAGDGASEHLLDLSLSGLSALSQSLDGMNDDVRSMPAARPLLAMTRAILALASSIISSPSIADPFLPPASDVAWS